MSTIELTMRYYSAAGPSATMNYLKAQTLAVFLCLICVEAELVQVVTPEGADGSNSNATTPESLPQRKRESPFVPPAPSGPIDSYLAALRHSQGASTRYDPPSQPDNGYGPPTQPDNGYGPPSGPDSGYGPGPSHGFESYNDPQQDNTYGPPKGYPPSKPFYHVPKPAPPMPYGPPAPTYLPPAAPSLSMPFAAPTDLIGSALKTLMPKGIDLETICKLLLKLMIFKLLVKFMGIIFIMLVAPMFHQKEMEMKKPQSNDDDDNDDDEEEDDRQFGALNELTALVWDSINPERYTNTTTDADDDDSNDVVEKVAGEIDDKMATPTEDVTIKFLEFCVSVANMAIGWMTSMVRRRNNEHDPLELWLWAIWDKIKAAFLTPTTYS